MFGLHDGGRFNILAGCVVLPLTVSIRIGCRRFLALNTRWHLANGTHGICAREFNSLRSCMASQVLGSCPLLMLVLTCKHFSCPGVLARVSACLLRGSFLVEALVAVLWGRSCSEAQRPFWTLENASHQMKQEMTLKGWMSWVCWLLSVLCLSCLVIIDTAGKCIPSFLLTSSTWIGALHIGIGLFQGGLCGVLLPYLAGLVSKLIMVQKSALMSPSLSVPTSSYDFAIESSAHSCR